MCCSLNQDCMYEVKVTDKYTAESIMHFSAKKGDIVMADAGYGTKCHTRQFSLLL